LWYVDDKLKTAAPPLLPIFRSALQAQILARLYLHAEEQATAKQLAESAGVTVAGVHKELSRLVSAGLVEAEDVGRTRVFRAARESPLYAPLRSLLERTVGVEEILRDRLTRLDGVEAAAIYGSWASGEVRPESDIDLLVIGEVDYGELASVVTEAERRAGREIGLSLFSRDELRQHLQRAGFLSRVLGGELIELVGSIREVARAA
jgi:predicted nucleotidyltransferase